MTEPLYQALTEQKEHYAQAFAMSILNLVDQQRGKLTAFEVLGIIEACKGKIVFELNLKALQLDNKSKEAGDGQVP